MNLSSKLIFLLSTVLVFVQSQQLSDHLVNSDICGETLTAPSINVRCLGDCKDVSEENQSGPSDVPDVVELHQTPWMALLVYQSTRGFSQATKEKLYCSGSVISPRFVLTSARCVVHLKSIDKLTAVRVGEHDYNSTSDCGASAGEETCAPLPVDIPIAKVIPHPRYSRFSLENDIALLRLEADIDFSGDGVKPICLPVSAGERNRVFTNEPMSVTGWGLETRGAKTTMIQSREHAMVSNTACSRHHSSRTGPRMAVTAKHFCYGGSNSRDACLADNGSPIVHEGLGPMEGKAVQYGVRSYHPGCNVATMPGVATRVGPYVEWILATVNLAGANT